MLDAHRRRGCKIIHMQGERKNLTDDVRNEMQNLGYELYCSGGKSLRMRTKINRNRSDIAMINNIDMIAVTLQLCPVCKNRHKVREGSAWS